MPAADCFTDSSRAVSRAISPRIASSSCSRDEGEVWAATPTAPAESSARARSAASLLIYLGGSSDPG